MFRIIIILGIVGGLCWLGWQGFNRIITPKTTAETVAERAGALPVEPPPLPVVQAPPPPVASPGEAVPGAGVVEATGFYVFRNRTVPAAPFARQQSTLGTSRDDRGFQLSTDPIANAWIMRGPPLEVDQFKLLAKSLDVVQDEVDLDFVLVSVSEDWLRSWGLSLYFREGASWASALSLDPTGGTLRFASQSVAIDANLEASNSAVRLVSSPVVRCMTGEPWSFSADQQVPVAILQRSEGVVSTAYEYRDVGLGLNGTLRKQSDQAYRLEIEQRNGSVDGGAETESGAPPQLREQVLKTSLVVEVGQWSCVGGVRTWRVEKRNRILGADEREEQDLLLVFCRPRLFLEATPRGVAVGPPPEHLEGVQVEAWELDGHPLLPPKPGKPLEALEAEFLEERRAARRGHPAGK